MVNRINRLAVVLVLGLGVCLAQVGSFSFSKTVTTAGTRVALSSSALRVRSFLVIAKTGNSGTVYVGGADVSSSNGSPLVAGQAEGWLSLGESVNDYYDLATFYIDASANTQGVIVRYVR